MPPRLAPRYFECHITLAQPAPEFRPALRRLIESHHWVYSAIDNDPALGPGVKAYATRHFRVHYDDAATTTAQLPPMAQFPAVRVALDKQAEILHKAGYLVVRKKVELVVYDQRLI